MVTHDIAQEIAKFGRKYMWWKPVDGQPHSEDRVIAQTMNLGTYDDILVLEQTVGRSWPLLGVLARAAIVCDGNCDPGRGSAQGISERAQRHLVQISLAVSQLIHLPTSPLAVGDS
jgi:hypothetical protein